jgi:hypothetical protein
MWIRANLGLRAVVVALVVGVIAIFAISPVSGKALTVASPPPDLKGTGLYSDFSSRTVDPGNLHYSPQYPLWSDGAVKNRWIRIPSGKAIDSSDPDVWKFPVGAKVWKEFTFNGKRVETRFMEMVGPEKWILVTYVWNAEQTEAVLAPEEGLRGVTEIQPGVRHDIPAVQDCNTCHVSEKVEVLGFSALQLSSDRDSDAPNAEPLTADMINLDTVIKRGLIKNFPPSWAEKPPRIDTPDPVARAALGYLHANCGNCHNVNSPLSPLGIILRHSLAPNTSGEAALQTSVNRIGQFLIPETKEGETFFIRPRDPERSSVVYRMASRNTTYQMPPLGTKIADSKAVDLIRKWIVQMR